MSKRNGSSSKSNNSSDVDASVAESDGEQCLQIIHAKLWCFADAKNPEGGKVKNTCCHLDGGNRPWEV